MDLSYEQAMAALDAGKRVHLCDTGRMSTEHDLPCCTSDRETVATFRTIHELVRENWPELLLTWRLYPAGDAITVGIRAEGRRFLNLGDIPVHNSGKQYILARLAELIGASGLAR